MKKIGQFLIGLVVTLLLLYVVDWIVGTWSERMYHQSKFGIFHRQIYVIQESKEDLLILGSSRAAHHYVPQIFIDTLGISCYNAGSDGMCIYYQYAMLIARIHKGNIPRMVICEVMPTDVEASDGATFTLDAALDRLAPHYGELPEIDSLFALKGWKERLKMFSKTYRYNSKLVQIVKCNYLPESEDKGYEAIFREMDEVKYRKEKDTAKEINERAVEQEKIRYLYKFVATCKKNNIKLVFAVSPAYGGIHSKGIDLIKQIAIQESIPFIDNNRTACFQNPLFFADAMHLNDLGAKKYTTYMIKLLKESKQF